MSPHTPARLRPDLIEGEEDRWRQAAAIIDGYGDKAGGFVVAQLIGTAGEIERRTFWIWADLADKVEELQLHRLRPN